jgi:leucyl aminopeptidase
MACGYSTAWWPTITRADAFLPVAVRFAAVTEHFSARAGAGMRDGFDTEGQTVALDPALEDEAMGARAWAKLAEPSRGLEIDARDVPDIAAARIAAGAALRAWRMPKGPPPGRKPQLLVLCRDPDAARRHWPRIAAGVAGNLFARSLVAEPANRLTPAVFVERLRGLTEYGLAVSVLGPEELLQRGYGAISAVGRAAPTGPYLVTLEWKRAGAPLALVGKGLCFDNGGISIKPAAGMEAMRADMAGAAACAGAMLALALRDAEGAAVAVLGVAENAIGADAYRPGDVLTTASGRTVEIIDTDAEGRLVLADALHHALTHHKPRAVIDIATLTGSIVTALGHHRAGLFGNDDALRDQLMRAGEAAGEPLWPMPIGEAHRRDIDSDIADLKQCAPAGKLLPDACHAAAFLREFAGETPWAHLDIAGVETAEEDLPLAAKGVPTGFGARLFDLLV